MTNIKELEHTLNDIYDAQEQTIQPPPKLHPHLTGTAVIPDRKQFLADVFTLMREGGLRYVDDTGKHNPKTTPQTITVNFSKYDDETFPKLTFTVNNRLQVKIPETLPKRAMKVLEACLVLAEVCSETPVYLISSEKSWELLSWVNWVLKRRYDLKNHSDISEIAKNLGVIKEGVKEGEIEKFLSITPLNNNFCCGHAKFCWDLLSEIGAEAFMGLKLKHKKEYFTEITMGFIQCDIRLLKEVVKTGKYDNKELAKAIFQYYRAHGDVPGELGELFDSIIVTDITPEALKVLLNYLFEKQVVKKDLKVRFRGDIKEDELTGFGPEFATGRFLGIMI